MPRERRSYPASPQTPPLRWLKNICLGCALEGGWELRARQKIRCAFWRERRAGRCKAPRRRRCGGIVEERQRRRCPPAAAPLRAAARRPAGCVARSLHTAVGMLVARALPAGLGASSKMYTLFPDGPLAGVSESEPPEYCNKRMRPGRGAGRSCNPCRGACRWSSSTRGFAFAHTRLISFRPAAEYVAVFMKSCPKFQSQYRSSQFFPSPTTAPA